MGKDFFKTRYDLICPFGQWCGPSLWTRKLGLRACSLPLDWMRGDSLSFGRYVDLVYDDFKNFMRLENLVLLRHPPADAALDEHDIYLDRGSGLESHHDITPLRPLEEVWPEVRVKFDRRIARFYSVVRASRRTLFVHFVRTGVLSPAEIKLSVELLREKFQGCAIDVLILQHADNSNSIVEDEPLPGVLVLNGPFYAKGCNTRYGDLALCRRVFGHIRLKGRFKNLFKRRWDRFLWRLKCSCHWSSEKRREARRDSRQHKGGM